MGLINNPTFVMKIANMLGFGSLYYIDSKDTIIVMAMIYQMLGGIGNGINNSSSMALLSSYEEQREEFISYFEVYGGLGALFGPLFGSLLYYLFGFRGPFFGIGLVSLIMVTLFYR